LQTHPFAALGASLVSTTLESDSGTTAAATDSDAIVEPTASLLQDGLKPDLQQRAASPDWQAAIEQFVKRNKRKFPDLQYDVTIKHVGGNR
jgi:hypothetical protein